MFHPSWKEQVPHPYKTAGHMLVLFILKERLFWTALPELYLFRAKLELFNLGKLYTCTSCPLYLGLRNLLFHSAPTDYGRRNIHMKFPTYTQSLTLYIPAVTIYTVSLTFNNSTFCPHGMYIYICVCVCVCVCLCRSEKNSDYFPTQH